ncbi:DUF4287 domain-containing protein [Deinococcus arcticus]|uniref:DUF4287 domain-containing protein n=1 Tax=Deinococcus arcticus TaxID=2136176 RepID=A0A2T3W6A0_9DEIO|nr:DUF4287 domain-containing protein [Deinococcus arcticus]PTA67421.1 DUF4287 domain-containing protein [Deinococcus arcticus]
MSFQAYLDAVQAQTGKTVPEFRELADEKGLEKHGQIVAWLKTEYGLGHGHATAVAAALLKAETRRAPEEERVSALFSGKKAGWQPLWTALLVHARTLGDDVGVGPTESYVSLTRGGKKFALVQPGVRGADVGLRLPGLLPAAPFEPAGSWNTMVTHRLRLTQPTEPAAEPDAALLDALRAAYQAR